MPMVVDWSVWEEKDYYGNIVVKGSARVNVDIPDAATLDANCKEVDRQYKELFRKVEEKLGRKVEWTKDMAIIHELGDWYAKHLRVACGRDPQDARHFNPLRTIDMVKAAEKLHLTPADKGWEQQVINAIEDGTIK